MRLSWLGVVFERASTARSPALSFPEISKGASLGLMYWSRYLQAEEKKRAHASERHVFLPI